MIDKKHEIKSIIKNPKLYKEFVAKSKPKSVELKKKVSLSPKKKKSVKLEKVASQKIAKKVVVEKKIFEVKENISDDMALEKFKEFYPNPALFDDIKTKN